jgi:hypothetical protein
VVKRFWQRHLSPKASFGQHTTRYKRFDHTVDLTAARLAANKQENAMKFTKQNDTHYECLSDSGSTYHLTARPIPDEFDSAMRCGIPADDDFVLSIPLVWSCSCPAGFYGRDCKHVRSLLRDVLQSANIG